MGKAKRSKNPHLPAGARRGTPGARTSVEAADVERRLALRPALLYGAAATILLLSLAAQIFSMLGDAQSYDEDIHLAAGYLYWKTGDLRWNAEHPPLAKWLSAAPLLALDPRLPAEHPSYARHDLAEFAHEFLYRNRVPADTMLNAARLVTVTQMLMLCAAVFLWTRSVFGDVPALVALAFVALEPNLIAHARYVTSDVPVTLFSFVTAACWYQFLCKHSWKWCIAAGASLGCALGTKFSAVYLLPALVLVAVVVRWKTPLRSRAAGFGAACMIAWAVLVLVYLPDANRMIPGARLFNHSLPSVLSELNTNTTGDRLLSFVGAKLGLAANTYFFGLHTVSDHNLGGHPSYLLGQQGTSGWWYYFPVTFAVKTAAGLLIALLLAVVAALTVKRERRVWAALFSLLLPAALFFGLSMASRINIGVRHILPVYPALAISAAALLGLGRWRWAAAACVAVLAVECAFIYPYYVSFFNVFIGGPSRGHLYLVDSNLDWGQDVKRLRRYVDTTGADHVCIGYFGRADLRYYGITDWALPWTEHVKDRQELDCLSVVSMTLLHGVYIPESKYAWIADRRPDATIGYSMRVYDLRKHRPAPK